MFLLAPWVSSLWTIALWRRAGRWLLCVQLACWPGTFILTLYDWGVIRFRCPANPLKGVPVQLHAGIV